MGKKIPRALYSCYYEGCAEEQTWPAEDLFWSERVQGFVCEICFDNDPTHDDERMGESLAQFIARGADL